MSSPGRLYFESRPMYLLYLDDAGSTKNPADSHVILAGLAVFERKPYWFSKKLDELAAQVWPDSPNTLEFRGNAIFAGRGKWRGIKKADRLAAYETALGYLRDSYETRLFGAAVNKAAISPNDPMEYAFEQMANRFDRYLERKHREGNNQRGLIILDESSYETSLQSLALEFRSEGHRWGQLHGLCDVPLFVNSKATRMIQYADLVAYALGKYYLKSDDTYFNLISSKFDNEGGVLHGLTHYAPEGPCGCFACN